MSAFITRRAAADLLGVATSTVSRTIERGLLASHGHRPGGCLDVDEVEHLAAERARARDQLAPKHARAYVRRVQPPDPDHPWLTVPQAAALVGITRAGMAQRCAHDTVPYTWSCGRRWIRRDLLDLLENAHAAQRAQRLEGGAPTR